MSSFTPRLVVPPVQNEYYRYPGYYVNGVNGLNSCLLMDPDNGYVLPNCVGYAWGRAYELLGSAPSLCQGDAYLWWTYNDGYPRGQQPRLGAIACMTYPNPGHVAVVERQDSPTEWTISESIWNGVDFRLGTIAWNSSAQQWWCWYDDGHGGTYNPWDVQGFIYPPYDWYDTGILKYLGNKSKKLRRIIHV